MSQSCETSLPTKPLDFQRTASVFKALGNPNRVMIVDAVSGGERSVADLTARLGLDMSTVSAHLSVLRNTGILKSERRGNQIFYSLRKPCLLNIFCCLEEFDSDSDS